MLREFSRVWIENRVMGVSLALLDEIDTLRADFNSIDQCLGGERVRQALQ